MVSGPSNFCGLGRKPERGPLAQKTEGKPKEPRQNTPFEGATTPQPPRKAAITYLTAPSSWGKTGGDGPERKKRERKGDLPFVKAF